MEKNVKVDRDLGCFSDVVDIDSWWNLLKEDLEKVFAGFSKGFFSVPSMTTATLYQPSVMFLALLDFEEDKNGPQEAAKTNQYRHYTLIGPFHKFILDDNRSGIPNPFSQPIISGYKTNELPQKLTLTLNDSLNRRRIILTATDIFKTSTEFVPDELDYILNEKALQKFFSSSSQRLYRGSSRKRLKTEEEGKPRNDEVNIIIQTISAKKLEISLFLEETCRFLVFNKEKPLLFKFETFKVTDSNKILFGDLERQEMVKWT